MVDLSKWIIQKKSDPIVEGEIVEGHPLILIRIITAALIHDDLVGILVVLPLRFIHSTP